MTDNGISQAENRVREMEKAARRYIEQSNRYMNRQPKQNVPVTRFETMTANNAPPAGERQKSCSSPQSQRAAPPSPQVEKIDTEKLLLIALIAFFLKEKADIKLIAALGYILL
ncbi:MAG: hypothetical protein ACI4RG_10295 [Huintestinicola sp.]